MEIIGYIFRILSNVDNPYAVAYFVAQVPFPSVQAFCCKNPLTRTVLLHRRRTSVFQRIHLLHRLSLDKLLRSSLLSSAA